MMMKLALALLAALPLQAMANEEDPIAYKCYYCTESEMEDVAIGKGIGRQYVYDYNNLNITGFDVSNVNGTLVANPITVEPWIKRQFLGYVRLFNQDTGEMEESISAHHLLAPGTEHSRGTRYLWGHHLSELHPNQAAAEKTVQRLLGHAPELSFLDTQESEGRLLRLEYLVTGEKSVAAEVRFAGIGNSAHYLFHHKERRWELVGARELSHPIQNNREEFVPDSGSRTYIYRDATANFEAFLDRARWAGIHVSGKPSSVSFFIIQCDRVSGEIQCVIS